MIVVILLSIATAVSGQISLKSGMNRVGRIHRGDRGRWRAGLPRVFLGLTFYAVSMVLWLFTLSRVELSYAFPFVSLSYVAIVLAARFGLGEELPPHRFWGSVLIVLGVVLVGMT